MLLRRPTGADAGRVKRGEQVDRELTACSDFARPAFLHSLVRVRLRAASDGRAHLSDGAFKPDEDGARDDVVADVELVDFVNGGDRADVTRGQAMTGGH